MKKEGRRQRSVQRVVVSIGTANKDVDHPAGASISYVSKHRSLNVTFFPS